MLNVLFRGNAHCLFEVTVQMALIVKAAFLRGIGNRVACFKQRACVTQASLNLVSVWWKAKLFLKRPHQMKWADPRQFCQFL